MHRPVRAEIDAQRIEAVAKDLRHAEQLDCKLVRSEPGASEESPGLFEKRDATAVAMIGVVEAGDVEPVPREKPEAFREAVDFIKIEQHPEHPVAQAMRPGQDAPVDHMAGVETGSWRHAASRPVW